MTFVSCPANERGLSSSDAFKKLDADSLCECEACFAVALIKFFSVYELLLQQ